MKPPTLLENVELDEISLVDEPANQHAKVVLFKRFDGVDEGTAEIKESEGVRPDAPLGRETEDGRMADKQTGPTSGAPDVEKQLSELTSRLEKLEMEKKDLESQNAELQEKAEHLQKNADKIASRKEYRDKLPKAMQDVFDKLSEEEQDAMMARASKAEKSEDPVVKAFTETAKRQEELEKRLEKMQREELRKGFVAKHAALEGPFEVAKLASIDEIVRKSDESLADDLMGRLTAISKQVEMGELFKSVGRDGQSGGQTVIEKVNKKAEELRKGTDMTQEQAVRSVLQDDRRLYAEYQKEV